MNILLIGASAIAAISITILLATRKMTLFALKYKMMKKKGYIPTIEVKKDRQVKLGVEKPDDDNRIFSAEGEKHAKEIDGDKMYWFQPFDSRVVFTREGDTEIYDPYEKGRGKGISAETVDRIAKQAKMQGMLESEQLMPQIRGIVIAIGLGLLLVLGLCWIIMQNTGQTLEIIEAGAPAARATANAVRNVTMT